MSVPSLPELTAWVHRGVAFFCLGSLIPAAFMAVDQVASLATWWLVGFGGGIVGLTLALVVGSLLGRSILGLARAYVIVVALAVLTWPLGWQSTAPATSSPWIWMCLGVASVWAALVFGTKWGFLYAILTGVVYAGVRLTPSGQGVPLVAAMQDLLVLVINPSAVIIGISLLIDSIRQLHTTSGDTQQRQARALVEEALVEERRRLDGIVHDEVMTTLVNAAMTGTTPDPKVAELAQHAIRQIELAGQTGEDQAPVTVEHVGWLVSDVLSSVLPEVVARLEVSEPNLPVPAVVARAIGQATREVAMNIARHAEARRVEVLISDASGPGVKITVTDDGTGFEPDAVPSDRLGLQLSVTERIQLVGGQAEVRSSPGQGTTVELVWLAPADPPQPRRPRRPRRRRRADDSALVLPAIQFGAVAGLIWLLVGLHFVLGWTTLDQVSPNWPVFVAQGCAVIATWLALRRLAANPLPFGSMIAVLVMLSATTLLVQFALPVGRWPGYATWHSAVVMVLLIVLLFRGRPIAAWVGVGVFVLESVLWAFTHRLGVSEVVRVAFGPISWMMVAQLIQGWLVELGVRVRDAQEQSDAANQTIAASYSKLVLRDAWLRQLQHQVIPLLESLADPHAQRSQAEVDACLALERRLRDRLRAANLLSGGTQDVVEAARERGVEVTLVDSRGSELPEPVRTALRTSLGVILADPSIRKVVARAAPEGYADVVTILTVRENGGTELVGLDDNGARTQR